MTSQPERFFLVVGASASAQLSLNSKSQSDIHTSGKPLSTYLVLPSVISCGVMRRLGFDLRREVKESLRNRKLGFDLPLGNIVVYQGKESSVLRRIE